MSRRIQSPDTAADIQLRELLDNSNLAGFVMIAGAGSGKTTSLIKALAHISHTRGEAFQLSGQGVACITYTEVAASEIKSELSSDPTVSVSTIHSFFWNSVKPFQNDIRQWTRERARRRLEKIQSELDDMGDYLRGDPRREKIVARLERWKTRLPLIDTVDKFSYGTGSKYDEGILGHEDIVNMVPELILTKPLLAKIIARRYPVIFIDESQDTFPQVVDCMRHIAKQENGRFCIGFFGDPVQKIYARGIGTIEMEKGWKEIKKPENFRSPQLVLDVINAIRTDADGLLQISGLQPENQRRGERHFFVLRADERRTEALEAVRSWLADNSTIGAWQPDQDGRDTKILVIAHRMAANRLGFGSLYEVFHRDASLRDAFDEGRAWPLDPFMKTLLPLAGAAIHDRARIIPLLRAASPLLQSVGPTHSDARKTLDSLASGLKELTEILNTGGPKSVEKALRTAWHSSLLELDERIVTLLRQIEGGAPPRAVEENPDTIAEFLAGDVREIRHYAEYIQQNSPYSTHQGVKGAEFPYVLVVLDDEEGRHNQFSYDKLLRVKPLSARDQKRAKDGLETIVDRTRRLLYVCASRATEALAIVLYARDVDSAVSALKASKIPGTEEVRTLDDLTNTKDPEILAQQTLW